MLALFSLSLLATSKALPKEQTESQSISLPSACNFLDDGYHYILPFDGDTFSSLTGSNEVDAKPIYVYCNNGYTVINVDKDTNIKNYFSSFHDYLESVSGPDLSEHTSWENWWLPSKWLMESTKDSSPISWSVTNSDCTVCLTSDDLQYGSKTAYYMTPDVASCNWPVKGICDFDHETLECYTCTPIVASDSLLSGKCGHVQLSADSVTNSSHSECTELVLSSNDLFLPAISTSDSYCVCYKPNDDYVQYYDVESSVVTSVEESRVEKEEEEEAAELDALIDKTETNIVYLSSVDFEDGTYRITESGTYKLTEDIFFNPHGLTKEQIYDENMSPNGPYTWMPYPEQSDDYPGAGEYDGWYWLGFFAAITIEASNVVVDLQGFTIAMDTDFYYQQRYFIVIQISNKPFADSAGPTWTGVGQITDLSNIKIQNGVIGLSSHIGIHAVVCHGVTLSNLHIKDFETHGVVFNGFTNVALTDVEIGPSVSILSVTGNYNLARLSLSTLRDAVSDIGDQTISFYNRAPITYGEIFNRLVTELDLVFKYVAYQDETVVSHPYWQEAKDLFYSDLGVTRAGTLYGAVFRCEGAEVFNFGTSNGNFSSQLRLTNVQIHDLEVATEEIVTVYARQMLNAPIPFAPASSLGLAELGRTRYIGNTWVDILIALHSLSNNWWYLNRFACDEFVCNGWALYGTHMSCPLECGLDSLGHISKGAVGIKIEFVADVVFSNVEISNVYSLGDLGSSLCGNWSDGGNGGPRLQTSWSNKGYMAPFANGIIAHAVSGTFDNVKISNIVSYYGPAYGYYLLLLNKLELSNNEIYNIFGGVMNKEDYSTDKLPNRANRACAIETNTIDWSDVIVGRLDRTLVGNTVELSDVNQYCFNGHAGCGADDQSTTVYTTLVDSNSDSVNPTSCTPTTLTFSDGRSMSLDEEGNLNVADTITPTYWRKYFLEKKNQIGDINSNKNYLFTPKFVITTIIIVSILLVLFIFYKSYGKQKQIANHNGKTTFMTENDPLLTNRI